MDGVSLFGGLRRVSLIGHGEEIFSLSEDLGDSANAVVGGVGLKLIHAITARDLKVRRGEEPVL